VTVQSLESGFDHLREQTPTAFRCIQATLMCPFLALQHLLTACFTMATERENGRQPLGIPGLQ
jgi:hypothetical protein